MKIKKYGKEKSKTTLCNNIFTYNVFLDYGDRELLTIFKGYSIEEVTEEVKQKYPNVKFDIKQAPVFL